MASNNFAGTTLGLVTHTKATDKANGNRARAIMRADGAALRESIPAAVLALRSDGLRSDADFAKGERTDGSRVKVARETLKVAYVDAGLTERASTTWWNRLRLIAKSVAFRKFETAEGFFEILETHLDDSGNEDPITSLKALDRMLAGAPDLGARAEKQAGELVKTIGKLSKTQVATFWETDNAKALKALIG